MANKRTYYLGYNGRVSQRLALVGGPAKMHLMCRATSTPEALQIFIADEDRASVAIYTCMEPYIGGSK